MGNKYLLFNIFPVHTVYPFQATLVVSCKAAIGNDSFETCSKYCVQICSIPFYKIMRVLLMDSQFQNPPKIKSGD